MQFFWYTAGPAVSAAGEDPQIGLVGPVSNNVSGQQQAPVGYAQLAELDGWAWDRQRSFLPGGPNAADAVRETDRLVGFCLLIRRQVIDRIGPFDERFGIGCFEDDDYCRRAIGAGYKAVIARAAFVHHFGSATFRASGVDFGTVMRENRRLYEEKWDGNGAHTPDNGSAAEETEGSARDEDGEGFLITALLMSSMTTIRPATTDDTSAITRVQVQTWRSAYRGIVADEFLDAFSEGERRGRWLEILQRAGQYTFVAEAEGQGVVGFANGGPERDGRADFRGELYGLYVLPDWHGWHGQGIGRRLVGTLALRLIESGVNTMIVWVLAGNRFGCFYEHLGGQLVGKREIEIGKQTLDEVAYGWDDVTVLIGDSAD